MACKGRFPTRRFRPRRRWQRGENQSGSRSCAPPAAEGPWLLVAESLCGRACLSSFGRLRVCDLERCCYYLRIPYYSPRVTSLICRTELVRLPLRERMVRLRPATAARVAPLVTQAFSEMFRREFAAKIGSSEDANPHGATTHASANRLHLRQRQVRKHGSSRIRPRVRDTDRCIQEPSRALGVRARA